MEIAKTLVTEFRAVKIEQVGRDLNSYVNALADLALVFEREIGRTIVVDLISVPSHEIHQESVLSNTELGTSWMDKIT